MIPFGVVQVKIYDTETEYRMANTIQRLRKENIGCKRVIVLLSLFLVLAITLGGIR